MKRKQNLCFIISVCKKTTKCIAAVLFTCCLMLLFTFFAGAEETEFADIDSASEYVRSRMVHRDTAISFVYEAPSEKIGELNSENLSAYFAARWKEITASVFTCTGVGYEGDYLKYHVEEYGYSYSAVYSPSDDCVRYNVAVSTIYRSTAAQEQEVTQAVDVIVTQLHLSDLTEEQKLRAITDFICDAVSYDYDNLNNDEYTLKYTAYAALVNGTAVCQGYSSLFYRLALEAGLDCRIVSGTADNGLQTERHAWNIVKVDDQYYYIDPTWIDGSGTDQYYLRGKSFESDHFADDELKKDRALRIYFDHISPYDYISVRNAWLLFAADSFAGGSGTTDDPYQIASAAQLALLSNLINNGTGSYNKAYYLLTDDIDLAGHSWLPIALYDNPMYRFTGLFDGAGHTISNMTVDEPFDGITDEPCYGLFGSNAGFIRNVILKDPVIEINSASSGWQSSNGMGTSLNCGGIAGESCFDSVIDNCLVKNIRINAVSAMSVCCGGLVGSVDHAAVVNSFVTGSISAVAARGITCGGFCGDISNEVYVCRCGFEGSVYSENLEETGLESSGYYYVHDVGGFVGKLGRANSNVEVCDCYAKATIDAISEITSIDIGGFAGSIEIVYETFHLQNLFCESTYYREDMNASYNGYISYGTHFCEMFSFLNPYSENIYDLAHLMEYSDDFSFTDLISKEGDTLIVFNRDQDDACSREDQYQIDAQIMEDVFSGFNTDVWNIDTATGEVSLRIRDCGICALSAVSSETCTVILTPPYAAYNGEKQKPSVTVIDADNRILTKGTDYHLSYYGWSAMGFIDPGKYEVAVVFFGNYSGKITVPFVIYEKTNEPGSHEHQWEYTKKTKTENCTENGELLYTCELCGATKTEEIPALGHRFRNYNAKTPTCTEIGWNAYQTCLRCKYTTYEEIPALGHDYIDHAAKEATCTATGWNAYRTCSRCDFTSYEKIPALGHAYIDHEAKAATCTEIGWNAYKTCSRCDYSDYAEIPALDHDYVEHDAKAATCTETGWKAYKTCSRCDYTSYEKIDALGHDYIGVVTEPTCTEDGCTTYTCSRCGDSYTADETDALGHDYVDHDGQAATCLADGWKSYQTCTRCDYTSYEKIDALGHDYVDHEGQAATCLSDGWKPYQTCSRCDYTSYEKIDALGHNYVDHDGQAATCLADGWQPYQTCSRCDYTSYEKIDALGHDYGEWTQTTNPTCTEAGVETRYCSRCDATETRPVEECGHDYIGVVTEPTCTEDGYTTYTCSRCGDSYTADETDALGHDYVNHDGQSATCLADGWNAYQTCTRCDYTSYEKIDALGHDYVNHDGQAATCLADGWKPYQTCTRCDYTSYEKIDALGHDYVNHDGQAATCLADGWKPYQTCTRCDYTSFEKINALGHDYVDHEGQDATCLADGWKPYQTCTRCDYTNYEKIDALGHDLIPHEAKEATCTDVGWKAYNTCSRCDYTTYVEIPALTHNWGEWENNTATCIAGGTEMRECSRCHETESRNTAALGHDYVNHEGQAATCLADGWKPYQTCTRCDYTSYEKIDALGHDYVDHGGQTATCTEIGWKAYKTCSRCDYTTYEEISALGHDYVEHTAKAATCTEIGWDTYQTCSRCDYTTYKEIAALGHDYVNHDGQAATCIAEGWKTYQTCTRCDYTSYEEIAVLGHDYVDHDAKAATCTGIGWKAYKTCSRCDYTSYEELPALGHDYGDWLQTQAPSCTEKGEEKRTCSRCDATETRTVDALTHKFTVLQSDATSHWYACANGCGMCTEKETHSFGEWITDVPATAEQEGTAHRICVSCQYKETKTLPKEIEAYLFGDVNHDGMVTAADARLALRKAVELEHYEEGSYEFFVSDVDFDGKVTAADARLILRAAVNLEDPNTWLEEYRALVSDTMSELSLSFGDVDRNTRIEPADARLALRISLGLLQDGTQTMDEVNKLAADVDVDGEVNPGDARLILRKSLGLDVASEGWNDV